MIYIILSISLLAVIALAEVVRAVLTFWPTSKKNHFKQKAEGVGKMIWDLEFKLYKTREIREGVRMEHANTKSKLAILLEEIKNWPADKDEGDRKRLEDKRDLLERDVGRFEEQMKALDLECAGSKPTNEYPSGAQGIEQQIESLRELRIMLNEWLKKI